MINTVDIPYEPVLRDRQSERLRMAEILGYEEARKEWGHAHAHTSKRNQRLSLED